MTKREELAFLGETVRQDFLDIIGNFSCDGLDHADFNSEDWFAFREVATDIDTILYAGFELAVLEKTLTSGFLPTNLVVRHQEPMRPASEAEPTPPPSFFAPSRHFGEPRRQRDNRHDGGGMNAEASASDLQMPQTAFTAVKGLKDFTKFLESGAREAGAASGAPHQWPTSAETAEDYHLQKANSAFKQNAAATPNAADEQKATAQSSFQTNTPHLGQNSGAGIDAVEAQSATFPVPSPLDEASDLRRLLQTGSPKDDFKAGERIRPDDSANSMAGPERNSDSQFPVKEENWQQHDWSWFDNGMLQGRNQNRKAAGLSKKPRRKQRHSSWPHRNGKDDFLPQALTKREETERETEESPRVENDETIPAFDLDEILRALSREIEREYRRFYGS